MNVGVVYTSAGARRRNTSADDVEVEDDVVVVARQEELGLSVGGGTFSSEREG